MAGPFAVRTERGTLRSWLTVIVVTSVVGGLLAAPNEPAPKAMTLDDLINLGLARHPKLQQAEIAVETARGLAIQAGLCPNPVLNIGGDEIGDRTGPGGTWSPMVTQEIVVKKKLPLARAAAERTVDQATWQVATQRAAMMTSIRQAFFDLLATQARLDVQMHLVELGERSVATVDKLAAARQASRIDVLQLTVELERFRADTAAVRAEVPAAFRRLAAVIGVVDLPSVPIVGVLEAPLPDYNLDRGRQLVLTVHPELQVARIGVDKSQLLLARARVEPYPNLTFGAGYIRQTQNRSNDYGLSLAFPVPVWNRNQGNIRAAQAQVADAHQEVNRVEADLTDRFATAYRDYASARRRAEHYRDAVLPRARELTQLSLQAQAAGQLEALKVLAAQTAIENARLELVKAYGDAWKAAATIAGLTLEEPWPPISPEPAPQPQPGGERK